MIEVLRYDTLQPKQLYYPVKGSIALRDIHITLKKRQWMNMSPRFSVRKGEIIVYRITAKGDLEEKHPIKGRNNVNHSELQMLLRTNLKLDTLSIDPHHLYIPPGVELVLSQEIFEDLRLDHKYVENERLRGMVPIKPDYTELKFPKKVILRCNELKTHSMYNGTSSDIMEVLHNPELKRFISYTTTNLLFFKLDDSYHQYETLTFILTDEKGHDIDYAEVDFTVLINERL